MTNTRRSASSQAGRVQGQLSGETPDPKRGPLKWPQAAVKEKVSDETGGQDVQDEKEGNDKKRAGKQRRGAERR